MMKRICAWGLVAFVAMGLVVGCSGGNSNNPLLPSNTTGKTDALTQSTGPEQTGHYLWGYYLVRIDEKDLSARIVPIRATAAHLNVLQFLEQAPCTNCFKLAGVSPNPDGTLNVNVSIKHPFSNPNLTGFDVRGIAMFSGSHLFPGSGLIVSDRTLGEGEVVNADGYTTLFNPTTGGHGFEGYVKGKLATVTAPTATLNGHKRFVTDDPANTRNAFYAGDEIIVTYRIDMPDAPNPWVFGYAIDASWAQAIHKPVVDPITDFGPEANCTEAWKMVVQDLGPGLTSQGGTTILQVDIYDRQGKDEAHPVRVECPELFDGEVEGSWATDGDGYTRYEAMVENVKLAPPGDYQCLISKEAQENDPSGKPWLDLTACQVFPVAVGWPPGYPVDVTPPWLNFSPHDVCVAGDLAYVAGSVNGLHVFDISDPVNPIWVTRVDTPGEAQGVAVSGGYAYVADGDSGLQIIDVEPLESAYIVKSVDTGEARKVAVLGGYAYVTRSSWQLRIVDIDPPESAYVVNSVATDGAANGVAASGGYAYVAVTGLGLQVIDVDPPESACIVKSVEAGNRAYGVTVSGNYVYMTDAHYDSEFGVQYPGFVIVDVQKPDLAFIVTSQEIPFITYGYAYGITVSGDCAYFCAASALQVFHVEPPEFAYFVKTVDTPGHALEVAVWGDYAYVADVESGLQVIDIEPPESAFNAGSAGTPGHSNGVAVQEGYAYVAGGSAGLQVIDIDPLEIAHFASSVDTPGDAVGVTVSGSHAYAADEYRGLQIIDIASPESGYIVKSVDTPGDAVGVAVEAGYAYVTQGLSGLGIIDVEPPESAYLINSVDTPENALEVAISGGYAFVADEESGLQVIDVNPPESAFTVKAVLGPGSANGVAVSGGHAYVSQHASGFSELGIVDIEPPESANMIQYIFTPQWAEGVAVSGSFAYVANDENGLQVVDIEPPGSASLYSSVDTPGIAIGVAVSGGYAYIADSEGGLRIIKLW